jgi:hypothetical protein
MGGGAVQLGTDGSRGILSHSDPARRKLFHLLRPPRGTVCLTRLLSVRPSIRWVFGHQFV